MSRTVYVYIRIFSFNFGVLTNLYFVNPVFMNIKKMTDRELYEYSRMVGANLREWKKKFVALLPEIARRGIHRKHGFATITEFAAKVGGVGKNTVERVFQVSKLIDDKPMLKEFLPEVGVHKMKVIATVATKENQKILAKKVVEMSKAALEKVVKAMRNDAKDENLFS